MNYRKFGKLDWEVSALGFGAMRLPILDRDSSKIDEPEAIKMIRHAIDRGVNYVDTAYGYHGGNSERLVGKALKDGYRQKVALATKLPAGLVETYEDFDKFLDEQLEKLQADRIDFYLLHGLSRNRWPKVRDLGVTEWAEEKIEEGKIGHIGFSFHDNFELLKEIIDYYDGWTFCQIQYNYMDTESSQRGPGVEGLKYAAAKGLAVIIMEPIQGGRLSMTPPAELQMIWDEAETKRTGAEWALQWVWNQPEVSVVLSGMSIMRHVEENLVSAGRSGPGTLTEEELALVKRIQQKYGELGYIGCTKCDYCQPCPQGVLIPDVFEVLNQNYTSTSDETKAAYHGAIPEEGRASKCEQCGECEEQCPQGLPIMNLMRGTSRMYDR
ncbi:aldo/keto reductase [Candidatus Bathyarchaeota archaeon]|nr:aldo/keto reductase [Candidatus Bathyarchaeota archaeon]MBL7080300.1 aldo/keto reductase [Candidatus Bathyarchaeota archaeon]